MAVNENTELIDPLNVSRAPHREAAQRYSDGVVRASNAKPESRSRSWRLSNVATISS